MKQVAATLLFSFVLLIAAGCEPADTEMSISTRKKISQLAEYSPAKVDVLPLTEFTDDGGASILKVYVSLLDRFDCQIKSPAVFRFELYNKVPRSAQPKGKRVKIWSDIDLSYSPKNNEHWQDFLRSYKFDLPVELDTTQTYILQVTARCPNGRRLLTEFTIRPR